VLKHGEILNSQEGNAFPIKITVLWDVTQGNMKEVTNVSDEPTSSIFRADTSRKTMIPPLCDVRISDLVFISH
jgi:hypothetical protein